MDVQRKKIGIVDTTLRDAHQCLVCFSMYPYFRKISRRNQGKRSEVCLFLYYYIVIEH